MLEELIQLVQGKQLEVHGIRVMQEGKIIGSHDFTPITRHPIYSATKSFTSTAVGLALEETDLSLEDSILKYLEEDLPKDCSMAIKDKLAKVTIRRLLTMSVPGFPFRPEGDNWLAYSLSIPLPNFEKEEFSYSNIPAYLAGVIIEKVVGQNLSEYLKHHLFSPLGIDKVVCSYCPSGHFYGASGMYLSVDELARLGQLYLQQGYWKGNSILPSNWVREATSQQIYTREGGYGYYFWRCSENGYRVSGKWGQRCFVFPDKDLVITYLANLQDEADSKAVSRCMYETIWSKL